MSTQSHEQPSVVWHDAVQALEQSRGVVPRPVAVRLRSSLERIYGQLGTLGMGSIEEFVAFMQTQQSASPEMSGIEAQLARLARLMESGAATPDWWEPVRMVKRFDVPGQVEWLGRLSDGRLVTSFWSLDGGGGTNIQLGVIDATSGALDRLSPGHPAQQLHAPLGITPDNRVIVQQTRQTQAFKEEDPLVLWDPDTGAIEPLDMPGAGFTYDQSRNQLVLIPEYTNDIAFYDVARREFTSSVDLPQRQRMYFRGMAPGGIAVLASDRGICRVETENGTSKSLEADIFADSVRVLENGLVVFIPLKHDITRRLSLRAWDGERVFELTRLHGKKIQTSQWRAASYDADTIIIMERLNGSNGKLSAVSLHGDGVLWARRIRVSVFNESVVNPVVGPNGELFAGGEAFICEFGEDAS